MVSCVADIAAATVACAQPSGGGDQALIIGRQGEYVQLTSSNITVSDSIFGFDVTVQNLIHQAMGTTDGVTPDPAGIRVFFSQEPVSTSGGTIRVGNADGFAPFMEADRPYYQYPGILPHNATTDSRRWQFVFSEGVDTFEFRVFVSTEVQYTDPWIDLSANRTYFVRGDTSTLTAVIRDPFGNELDGTVTWGTSNPSLASVDANGYFTTSTNFGFGSITAEADGATGELTFGVCTYPTPGAEAIFAGSSAERLCVFSGDLAGEYVLVPVNTSQETAIQVTTTASGIVPAIGPPNPLLSPKRGASFVRAGAGSVADWHSRGAARGAAGRGLTPGAPSFVIVPGTATVGDEWDLTVASSCSDAGETRRGRVAVVGEHAIIVVDTANPAAPAGLYEQIAVEIDSMVAPVVYFNFNGTTFAEPTDGDTNGAVVYFFSTAVTDQLDPAASGEYGYFAPRDLEAVEDCASSNEGEIIYLAAPDSTVAADSVAWYSARTVAHELQHLVNYSYRAANGQSAEEPWLDEAMSRAAQELVFYYMSGTLPEQNLSAASVSGAAALPFARMLGEFADLRSWLAAPHTAGPIDPEPSPVSSAAAHAFLRYYLDRVAAPGDHAARFTQLVRSGQTGVTNLTGVMGGTVPGFLRDFATAMYVDDAGVGAAGALQHASWNFRSVLGGAAYPILATQLADGAPIARTYAEGGGAGYLRFGMEAESFVEVRNTVDGGTPPGTVRFQIVRTR